MEIVNTKRERTAGGRDFDATLDVRVATVTGSPGKLACAGEHVRGAPGRPEIADAVLAETDAHAQLDEAL